MEFVVKEIELKNDEGLYKGTAFAEFNKGYSHLIVDDGCWVITNGTGMSAWIFPEAAEVLKQLPSNPNEYEPYRKANGIISI